MIQDGRQMAQAARTEMRKPASQQGLNIQAKGNGGPARIHVIPRRVLSHYGRAGFAPERRTSHYTKRIFLSSSTNLGFVRKFSNLGSTFIQVMRSSRAE